MDGSSVVYVLGKGDRRITIWDDGSKYIQVDFQQKGAVANRSAAYAYGRDKAKAMWAEKVALGWNRLA